MTVKDFYGMSVNLPLLFCHPVTVNRTVFDDRYFLSAVCKMKTGSRIHTGCQIHSSQVAVIAVAVDESDEVLFLHRVKYLSDTYHNIGAIIFGNVTAGSIHRYRRDMFRCGFTAFFLRFPEYVIIVFEFDSETHRTFFRFFSKCNMAAGLTDKTLHIRLLFK